MALDLQLETHDNDGQSVVNSSNIKQELIKILKKVHSNPEKHEIGLRDKGFKIACPYCGDSKTSMSKKRGNIYLDTSTYKCYNCNIWKPLDSFFKGFGGNNIVVGQFSYDNFINQSGGKGVNLLDLYSIKEQTVNRKDIMAAMRLEDVVYNEKVLSYMGGRNQNPKDRCFATRWNGDIINFNIHRESEKVIGMQLRISKPKKGGARFISYGFGDIMKKILKKELTLEEEEEARKIRKISLTFNLLNVDLSKPLNVFESAFDSSHWDNSVACWGSDNTIKLDTAYYFFDADTAGKKASIKLLEEGYNVFMWEKFKNAYPTYKECGDMDDVYRKRQISIEELRKFCTKDRLDIMQL